MGASDLPSDTNIHFQVKQYMTNMPGVHTTVMEISDQRVLQPAVKCYYRG